MSSFPVDLKDRLYQHADFLQKNYVTGVPDFLGDANATLLSPYNGFCKTSRPLLPSLRKINLTCSRNRRWFPGTILVFTGKNSRAQRFGLLVTRYDPVTGALVGQITHIDTTSSKRQAECPAEVYSDTFWEIRPIKGYALEYSRTNGSVLPLASGGLGASLITAVNTAKDNIGMDRPGFKTLKIEDDFTQPFVSYGQTPFYAVGFSTYVLSGTTFGGLHQRDWGVISTSAVTASIEPRGGFLDEKALFLVDATSATDFELHFRVGFGSLGDGSNRIRMRFGFTKDNTWNAADHSCFIEYDLASSSNWRYAVSNGSALSATASGTAVTADAWHLLSIIKVAGTITFLVNGVSLGTKVAGFPTLRMYPRVDLTTSLGTGGVRETLADFIRVKYNCGF